MPFLLGLFDVQSYAAATGHDVARVSDERRDEAHCSSIRYPLGDRTVWVLVNSPLDERNVVEQKEHDGREHVGDTGSVDTVDVSFPVHPQGADTDPVLVPLAEVWNEEIRTEQCADHHDNTYDEERRRSLSRRLRVWSHGVMPMHLFLEVAIPPSDGDI